MNTTPLHDQLAAIERELASLDIDGARERVRSAEAAFANTPFGELGEHASSAPGHHESDAQLRAGGVVKSARGALTSLEARAAELRRKADSIKQLLSAGERVAQGQAEVQRAQETAAASAAELAAANATCARLAEAIDAEKREAAAAVEASATAMLEAARTGADAGSVPVRPDKLAPLQAALSSAEAERDQAKTRHEADRAAITDAQRRVHEAAADASALDYQAAEAAFVAVAAQHVDAQIRAGRLAPGFMHLHPQIHAAAAAHAERAAIENAAS